LRHIIIILLLTSCSVRQDDTVTTLLCDQKKRWVYIDNDKYNHNSIATVYLIFHQDGTCENVWLKDNRKYEFDKADTWKYSGTDSLLTVFGHEFKMKWLQPDTISLVRTDNGFRTLLVNLETR
jgi:hypothetical protein